MTDVFNDEWANTPEWAAMYRAHGLQVVPAHRPGEGQQWKRPFGDWLEFRENLTSDAVFARWFDPETGEHRARKNLGLILGRASGGVFAIDLDNKEGSGAFAWWAWVVNKHFDGVEPQTWRQTTGGGGRHVLFRAPLGWEPPTFKTAIGVDLRGQGGFIIAAPSLHASGRIYDWEPGGAPWQGECLDAPEGLIEAIEDLRAEHGGSPGGVSHEHTASPDRAQSEFGRDIDGRESKIRDAVFAAVVDLYRDSPIPPPMELQNAEIDRLWTQYELTTKTRLHGPQFDHLSNGERLELEGRGRSEFVRKWAHLMRSWHTKVAEAAQVPKPDSEAAGPVDSKVNGAAIASPATDSTLDVPLTLDDLSPDDFHGQPPERLWLVDDWIVQNEVNSLYGMGGTGKTLLAQQLAYSAVAGEPWIGLPVKPCGAVLAVLCEDQRDELHRRHEDIRKANGHAIGHPYGKARLAPRYGKNNVLLTYQHDRPIYGHFHDLLKATLEDLNPELLILDTIRDVFTGDERAPAQVNTFLKTVLGGLILHQLGRGHSLTVLLLGHPSQTGQKEGYGLAGTLAWENAVRSRLYLTKPDDGAGNERVLTRGKANYSASGEETALPLVWANGVLIPTGGDEVKALVRAKNLPRWVRDRVEFSWSIGKPYMNRRDHDRYLHRAMVEEMRTALGVTTPVALAAIRAAIADDLIVQSKNTGKRGWKPGGGGVDDF